ncbi:MAG TPA: universal stress protein [Dehalococcoidia bacterium]|nr:universal stress protein [Dehalococcoidia bacterium]
MGASTEGTQKMKILVPIDNSKGSHTALSAAKRLAKELRSAHIILLSVSEQPETPELAREEEETMQHLLRAAEAELDGVPVRHRTSKAGDPARGIADAARDEQADLIVMATHGRTPISALARGSVAEDVVRSGVAPVTLVCWGENGR